MPNRAPITTDKQIRALKPEAARFEHGVAGTPGLRLRVYPSGAKSWRFRARNRTSGVLEVVTLGEYPRIGLADAREAASAQRSIVVEHGSARSYRIAERVEKRQALAAKVSTDDRAAYTVAKMVEQYLAEASGSLKGWREVDRALRKYVVAEIGETPAHDVTRKEVIALLDKLAKRGKRVQANRVLAYFRRCCNWAIAKDRLSANPCMMIERHAEQGKERFLTDMEISRFLANLTDSGVEDAVADVYRLILLTGLRPGEAAGIALADIDSEAGVIRLTDTKAGRAHVVPISAPVAALVKRRKQKGTLWLFAMASDAEKHQRADALPGPLREALPKLGILRTTPHDLRRTFGTGLARIGAPRLLISLALNHAVQGVTSIYDRHGYEAELRKWFDAWSTHVEGLEKNAKKATKSARAA